MEKYFLYLSFDGAAYHGWQVQPNAVTVQQRVEEVMARLFPSSASIVGAGRTDAGVNAGMMVAHADLPSEIDEAQLASKLNRMLPPDISVNDIRHVKPDAHARFSATARTYHYGVYNAKNPFRRHYATRLTYVPDYEVMNKAAALLLNVSDFTSFSKLHSDAKTNICDVRHAVWRQIEDDYWRFEITADRFLRNMVRAVVGTLLDVGRGRMSIDDFEMVIEKKNRCAAGDSVPANALSLVDISYPEDIFIGGSNR